MYRIGTVLYYPIVLIIQSILLTLLIIPSPLTDPHPPNTQLGLRPSILHINVHVQSNHFQIRNVRAHYLRIHYIVQS